MSGIPIHRCRFAKAQSDQKEFDSLVQDIAYNLANKLFYELLPCDHSGCPRITDEEFSAVKNRVSLAVAKEILKPMSRYIL